MISSTRTISILVVLEKGNSKRIAGRMVPNQGRTPARPYTMTSVTTRWGFTLAFTPGHFQVRGASNSVRFLDRCRWKVDHIGAVGVVVVGVGVVDGVASLSRCRLPFSFGPSCCFASRLLIDAVVVG